MRAAGNVHPGGPRHERDDIVQISDMIDGPVELVTFDLYDTLVEAVPPRWERFHRALEQSGFDVTLDAVIQADREAENYYTIENGRYPIRDRSEAEVAEFRLGQVRAYLEHLRFPTDADTVRAVQARFRDETQNHGGWKYRAFKEVSDVMDYLERHGVKRAVISNADADVTTFCLNMGFASQMDIIITSALVGWEKPDSRTFHAALEPLDVPPGRALHVGDQPLSDVLGARNVGMAAALIDRYGRWQDGEAEAMRVPSLMALAEHVVAYNAAFEEA
jgi:HAD superfamily hydrolase (TIGR01549 family)